VVVNDNIQAEVVTAELQCRAAAFHEAGHVVVAYRHRQLPYGSIQIGDDGGGLAPCEALVTDGQAAWARSQSDTGHWHWYDYRLGGELEFCQAGGLAEWLWHKRGDRDPAADIEFGIGEAEGYRSMEEMILDQEGGEDCVKAAYYLCEWRRAITKVWRLSDSDYDSIVRRYVNSHRKLNGILRRKRTWAAINTLAARLYVDRAVGDDDAIQIMEQALVPLSPFPKAATH